MTTLVKCGNLLTMDAPPMSDGWFTYDNGRLTAVGQGVAPAADTVLDFGQETVLPGLIDAHTHFSLSHSDPLPVFDQLLESGTRKVSKAVRYAREHLQSGVTTVRGMGEDDFIDFSLKDAIDKGYIPGPRISPAGAFISPTHGHGQTGQTVSDGVEGVRKNCRVNLAKGAELLKVFGSGGVVTGKAGLGYCTSTFEELRTAVLEAEALGKYVAAHVHGGPGLDMCLDAGVRSLEHATLCTDEQIAHIAAAGAWVTVTFSPVCHPAGLRNLTAEKQKRLDEVKAVYFEVVRKLLAKGIPLCAGTDGVHGGMWFEALQLEKCGANKLQSLEIITAQAARSCRYEEELGTLSPGKYADFIVLAGDPLADLENLRTVRRVYINGRLGVRS